MLRLTSTIRSVWLKTGNFCLELSWSQDLCKNHRFYWERQSNGPEWTRTPRSSSLDVSWSPSARLHSLSLPALCHMFSSKSFMGETSWVVQWITLRVPNAEGPGLIPARRWASLVAQTVKNLPANAGDPGLIPGLGRSPGEGNGCPLQYTCRENPMNREAWQAPVHGVVESDMTETFFTQKEETRDPHPSLSTLWAHSKGATAFKQGSSFSPDTQRAGTLILDFPASRSVRNKWLLFKPPRQWCSVVMWVCAQSCPTLRPHGLQPPRRLCPWDSPGRSTGLGCHFHYNSPDRIVQRPAPPTLQGC